MGVEMAKSGVGSAQPRYRVALFNSGDPRGSKVGGIETYIRDYIYYHPEDMDLLFVGADESGTLPIGEISEVEFRGRTFKFLPLLRLDDLSNAYGEGITKSDTWRFASLLMKNWGMLRRVLKGGGYSAEIRRVEYAPILRSMGVPVIQMVHIWGGKDQQMSSSLGKHWYIRDATEFVAAAVSKKYYAVNPNMTAMYKKKYWPFAKKFDTLTTWANTTIFQPTPYRFDDGLMHVMFAGRLDLFKRPDFMFRVIAALRAIHPDVRFHYVGDGDPEQFPEFAAIRDVTIRHGIKNSIEIAAMLETKHIGILTSDFEGMPRVVMEFLTAGRPVVARHLPQLEQVVTDGVSGYLIPHVEDHIELQARRMLEIFEAMKAGTITPESVNRSVEAFRPETLLGKIWKDHRLLHGLSA
jgi:glycosyltransferase involved in cell wall biosynthesis